MEDMDMNRFNASQRIGDIVAILPEAGEVFKEYNIDFCCGGHRLLAEALSEQGLDEREVLEKLNKAYEETGKLANRVDFAGMSSGELIDYIVNTHHVFLKKILPQLGELTTKVLRAHGPNHSELFKVHKLYSTLKTELEQHLIKEEEILFPAIKEYVGKPSKDFPDRTGTVLRETEEEHEAAGGILKELRKVTDEYRVPEDGCTTYHMTYEKLQELESDLFRHIHLENNILFKGFDNA
jgi:regulator of cell morphogenesis and NO signaling